MNPKFRQMKQQSGKKDMIDDKIKQFLLALFNNGGSCSRKNLPFADRDEDKVRQKCRRSGWAKYKDGCWNLTDAGHRIIDRTR